MHHSTVPSQPKTCVRGVGGRQLDGTTRRTRRGSSPRHLRCCERRRTCSQVYLAVMAVVGEAAGAVERASHCAASTLVRARFAAAFSRKLSPLVGQSSILITGCQFRRRIVRLPPRASLSFLSRALSRGRDSFGPRAGGSRVAENREHAALQFSRQERPRRGRSRGARPCAWRRRGPLPCERGGEQSVAAP